MSGFDQRFEPDPAAVVALVTSLRPELDLQLTLDRGTMTRLRAYMDRVERDEPGLAYAPGETRAESYRVAILALMDNALTGSEADEGLRYDFKSGHLLPARRAALAVRAKRAWRVLRRDW